jgi:hypothetical protein
MAMAILVHRIGTRQSDPERGFGGDQTLNVEGTVRGKRKCRAFNRRDKAVGEWPSGLKGSDEVSEVEVGREDCPDESGKRPGRPSKALLIGKEGIKHLSH